MAKLAVKPKGKAKPVKKKKILRSRFRQVLKQVRVYALSEKVRRELAAGSRATCSL